jgi:hypothetical protein
MTLQLPMLAANPGVLAAVTALVMAQLVMAETNPAECMYSPTSTTGCTNLP